MSTGSSKKIKLLVYADDVLIYDSREADRLEKAKEIDLNVENVEQLKIQAYTSDLNWVDICLADAKVQKVLKENEIP